MKILTLSILEGWGLSEPNYHHGNLKQALVEAGLDILREEGLAALSLRACAARVGVSHGAPKNHFASLAVLQAAIVTQGFRMFTQAMTAHVRDAPLRGRDQVLAIATGYVEFALANPDLFRLMFSMERQLDIYPELLPASQEAYAVLRDVSRWIAVEHDGSREALVARETMLWSWVHGYACLRVNKQFYTSNAETNRDPALQDIMPEFRYLEQRS